MARRPSRGQKQVAGVRIAVKQRFGIPRENRPCQQRSDHQMSKLPALGHTVALVAGNFVAPDSLHGRDLRRAVRQQGRDLHPRFGVVHPGCPGQVQLFLIQLHFETEFLSDLLKRLLVIQMRDFQVVAATVKVLADALQQHQFVVQPHANARLQNLEHALTRVTGRVVVCKGNDDRNTGFGQRRRLERDWQLPWGPQFVGENFLDHLERYAGRE